jgi:hypothetical protein
MFSWTVPEEYEVWLVKMREHQEKIAEKEREKKLEKVALESTPTAASGKGTTSLSSPPQPIDVSSKVKPISSAPPRKPVVEGPPLVFASLAEATTAFKTLLFDKDISAILKFKDVQDMCQDEPRWNALKTVGERKQALAEYQTHRMKLDREEQKAKSRKNRDAFFLLLAETTQIDSRMRYRDCVNLISGDSRYLAIEDNRQREDYFREFVDELEKKEKLDLAKAKTEATSRFESLLKQLHAEGKITRKSLWVDCKEELIEIKEALKDELFLAIDETVMRKRLQTLTDDLETTHREQERVKREGLKMRLKHAQMKFKADCLQPLVQEGLITSDTKWKKIIADHESSWKSSDCIAYTDLLDISTQLDSSIVATTAEGSSGSCQNITLFRDCFEEILVEMKETYREDRRLVRSTLDTMKFKISHYTKYEDFVNQVEAYAKASSLPLVLEMLSHRLYNMRPVFNDLYDPVLRDWKTSEEKRRRREDKFITLLEEYYYRSDHVSVTWEEAKQSLSKHSAYDALERADRRRLFDAHIDGLRAKLAARTGSMLAMKEAAITGPSRVAEEGEEVDPMEMSVPSVEKPQARPRSLVRSDAPVSIVDSKDSARSNGSKPIAGRGRAVVLPSWMTQNDEDVQGLSSVPSMKPSPHLRDIELEAQVPPTVTDEMITAGRGRGLTLPSWMTKPTNQDVTTIELVESIPVEDEVADIEVVNDVISADRKHTREEFESEDAEKEAPSPKKLRKSSRTRK